jgi:hypothetical protein
MSFGLRPKRAALLRKRSLCAVVAFVRHQSTLGEKMGATRRQISRSPGRLFWRAIIALLREYSIGKRHGL